VNVTFACPQCDRPARLALPGPAVWQCPACDHRLAVDSANAAADPLTACALCGNGGLYKKKDFPHGLGLALLTLACLVSFVTYGLYEKWLTWAILIGTALFDGLLYLWVGDAVVCYRCGAHYRGVKATAGYPPFDLGVGERYRQERIRREQLKRTADG
jgi:hypothetical protein